MYPHKEKLKIMSRISIVKLQADYCESESVVDICLGPFPRPRPFICKKWYLEMSAGFHMKWGN